MAILTLELNINSASNLANVNLFSKMNVFAVITLNGDYTRMKHKVKTSVDRSGGSNPTWNHDVKFTVNERLARDGRLTLGMRVISRRVLGNKDIGGVNVPLLELLNSIPPPTNGDGNGNEMKFMTYQLRTRSGKRSGSLTFSYRFKPDFSLTLSRSFPPPSQTENPPLAPPELPIEFPQLSQPPSCQNDSGEQKHPFTGSSSYDPLPVSFGAALMDPPYFSPTPSYKGPAPTPHPSSPNFPTVPVRNQGYESYSYAPPSPAGFGYEGPSSQQSKEIGLGLLSGLIMGDLVSDVANSFDL